MIQAVIGFIMRMPFLEIAVENRNPL